MDNLPSECGDTVSPLIFFATLLCVSGTPRITLSTPYSLIHSFFKGASPFFLFVPGSQYPMHRSLWLFCYSIASWMRLLYIGFLSSVFSLFASIYSMLSCVAMGCFLEDALFLQVKRQRHAGCI